MSNFRMNIPKILEQFQILYQNNRIKEEKNDLLKLTKTASYNWSSRVELGRKIAILLESEQDEFFQDIYEQLLQLINQ